MTDWSVQPLPHHYDTRRNRALLNTNRENILPGGSSDSDEPSVTGEQAVETMGDRNVRDPGEERFLQLLDTLTQGQRLAEQRA